MPLPLPQRAEDVTAEWVEEVLRDAGALNGGRVAAVRTRRIGDEIGFLSQTLRVDIDYAPPAETSAPRSIIAKLEPAAGRFRTTERDLNAFEREIRFYREIAPRLSLRLPRIFHTAIDAAGNALVMEDLSAFRFIDQVHGLPHGEVVRAVRAVAGLHATFWDRTDEPELAWIPAYDHFWQDDFAAHWPPFADAYGVRIGPDGLRLGERVAADLDRLIARVQARPATVIHADLRADNLLFGPEAVVILDWQLATRSLGPLDVARLLAGSEPPPERRGHQLEVLAAWHESLRDGGVTGYSLEQALDDFRLALLYTLLVPIKSYSLCAGEPLSGRTGRLVDAQADRIFAAALELDAATALD